MEADAFIIALRGALNYQHKSQWSMQRRDDVEGRGIGLYRDGGNEIPLFGCEQGDSSCAWRRTFLTGVSPEFAR